VHLVVVMMSKGRATTGSGMQERTLRSSSSSRGSKGRRSRRKEKRTARQLSSSSLPGWHTDGWCMGRR
jgi:hypothetical protein